MTNLVARQGGGLVDSRCGATELLGGAWLRRATLHGGFDAFAGGFGGLCLRVIRA